MNNKTKNYQISDYFYTLYRWKRIIIISTMSIGIILSGVSFFIPNTYKSTGIVMITPENTMGFGGLTGLLGGKSGTASLGSKLLGGNSANEDVILGILSSRSAMVNAIIKFKLFDYYNIEDKNTDRVLKAFRSDINFDLTENNFVEISVVNKNPDIAAAIAEYFIVVLDSINYRVNSEIARNNRAYVESRYLKNLQDLKIAEDSLFKFQKKYGLVVVPEQLELGFKAAAEVESEYLKKEIEAELLLRQFGVESPLYQSVLSEQNLLKQKIEELKNSSEISKKSNIFQPFKELPSLSINYLRTFREVEIQNKILEIVLPMYEQAKIEETKDIPAVIIIDKPNIPEIKYRPQRAFIVLSGMILLLFLVIPLVFRMETILNKSELNNPLEEKELKIYNKIKVFFLRN